MMGDAHVSGALLDLAPQLQADVMSDLQSDALGGSLDSYWYCGRMYAIPLDAAAPAASHRPDLLSRAGIDVPQTWDDLINAARRGLVTMPGFPADLFLNFMGLCVTMSGVIARREELFESQTAISCLEMLSELASHLTDDIYEKNPIAVYESMAREDRFAYCPFAYSYSNYSRPGFGRKSVVFGTPVRAGNQPIRTVLGGTGFAISSSCPAPDLALEYGLFTTGRECQRTLYGVCGGQPARRSSWDDPGLNSLTSNFFIRTLPAVESAFVRPRYPGYAAFQEKAGLPLVRYLRERLHPPQALHEIERLYRESRRQTQGQP